MAYTLGLISQREFKEWETLRSIRNKFAHRVHVSFGDQQICGLIRNLKLAAQHYGDVRFSPHGRFTTSVTALILNLMNRPVYVSRKRAKYGN